MWWLDGRKREKEGREEEKREEEGNQLTKNTFLRAESRSRTKIFTPEAREFLQGFGYGRTIFEGLERKLRPLSSPGIRDAKFRALVFAVFFSEELYATMLYNFLIGAAEPLEGERDGWVD